MTEIWILPYKLALLYIVMQGYSNGSLNLFVKRITLIVAFQVSVLMSRVNWGLP